MLQVKNYWYLSLETAKIRDASKVLAMSVQRTAKMLDGHRDLHRLDKTLGSEIRSSKAFIVDNWPAHPDVPRLLGTDLIFLPQNTTSVTQPMNQGVIRSLNAKYRTASDLQVHHRY